MSSWQLPNGHFMLKLKNQGLAGPAAQLNRPAINAAPAESASMMDEHSDPTTTNEPTSPQMKARKHTATPTQNASPIKRARADEAASTTSAPNSDTVDIGEVEPQVQEALNNITYIASAPGPRVPLKLEAIIDKNAAKTGHVEYLAMLAPPYRPEETVWGLACNFPPKDIEHYEQRDADRRVQFNLPVIDAYYEPGVPTKKAAIERAERRRMEMGQPSPVSTVWETPLQDRGTLTLVADDGAPITGYYHAKTQEEKDRETALARGTVGEE